MDSTLNLLIEQLEQERNRINENLGNGGPKDFAEYRYAVGMVRGLRIAQDLINQLAKHMELDDE